MVKVKCLIVMLYWYKHSFLFERGVHSVRGAYSGRGGYSTGVGYSIIYGIYESQQDIHKTKYVYWKSSQWNDFRRTHW